jgi:hypothetical protein
MAAALLSLIVGGIAATAGESQQPGDIPPPPKVARYARRLMATYDLDGDGQLQEVEWRKMRGQPLPADANRDGVITVDELTQWVATYGAQRRIRVDWPFPASNLESSSDSAPTDATPPSDGPSATSTPTPTQTASPPGAPAPAEAPSGTSPPAEAAPRETRFHLSPKRLPTGLPDWFRTRDADGDGQLSLSEFAPHATSAQQHEFVQLDLNSDGVLTPQEYLKATRKPAKPHIKP